MSFAPLAYSLVIAALIAVCAYLYRRLQATQKKLQDLERLKKEQLTTDARDVLEDFLRRGSTVVRINSENLMLWHGMRS